MSEKHRAYSHNFKYEVIQYAEQYSNRHCARHFNVDESNVRRWVKQKEHIKDIVLKGGMAAKYQNLNTHGPTKSKGAG